LRDSVSIRAFSSIRRSVQSGMAFAHAHNMSCLSTDQASAPEQTWVSSRLDAALLRFPRSLFPSEHPKLEAELREPPADLAVVTMLEALDLVGTERVLDVGSSSSYAAALLSQLASEVYTVVDAPELVAPRQRELRELGCDNVHVVHSKPGTGWQAAAPYQAILVGAAAQQLPLALLHQLDTGGYLVIPIGDAHAQLLERISKCGDAVRSETLGRCRVAVQKGAAVSPSHFPWSLR
jgi:protein-L-isoaspartate O-methyltransferase